MSKVAVTVERVDSINSHPNADKLEIAKILGYQVAVPKGSFKLGDQVYYFPPDILLPDSQAEELGVKNYLKHARFPGQEESTQCRVGAARLRGVPSHGFCVPVNRAEHVNCPAGLVVSETFGAVKYEPPARTDAGTSLEEIEAFHRYTEIENIQRYPGVFSEGEPVVITEKIHGTNLRMGFVRDGDPNIFITCAGSRTIRRAENGIYWQFLDRVMKDNLVFLSNNLTSDAIIFGEIFGPGIQDLHYGMLRPAFRAFDISINGQYMHHDEFVNVCKTLCIPTTPVLYTGEFSEEVVQTFTDGDSTFPIKEGFKGREGCVIRPYREQFSDELGGRKILKSVSVDYRDRRKTPAEDKENQEQAA